MRVLILGGDGMLGHRLLGSFTSRHDVTVTLRRDIEDYAQFGMFKPENAICGVDVRDPARLISVFARVRPELVVNAIGIVKQRAASLDVLQSLEVNSLLPHRLAALCRSCGSRLIQISTDCVFKGDRGSYTEEDAPDASDIYGRSKMLGEVSDRNCLTIRTSIVGLQLHRRTSLVEWFISQSGTVPGYPNAIFSGLTTAVLSDIILLIAERHPKLEGIYHISSAPISKYEFLYRLAQILDRRDLSLTTDDTVRINRTLKSQRFFDTTGLLAPSWDEMLNTLGAEIINTRS